MQIRFFRSKISYSVCKLVFVRSKISYVVCKLYFLRSKISYSLCKLVFLDPTFIIQYANLSVRNQNHRLKLEIKISKSN